VRFENSSQNDNVKIVFYRENNKNFPILNLEILKNKIYSYVSFGYRKLAFENAEFILKIENAEFYDDVIYKSKSSHSCVKHMEFTLSPNSIVKAFDLWKKRVSAKRIDDRTIALVFYNENNYDNPLFSLNIAETSINNYVYQDGETEWGLSSDDSQNKVSYSITIGNKVEHIYFKLNRDNIFIEFDLPAGAIAHAVSNLRTSDSGKCIVH
jgi:hypothetical protein